MIGLQGGSAMVIEENWGISEARMADFLSGQPDVLRTRDGFVFRDCRILLTALPHNALGKWPMPRTRVVITGSEDNAREIHRRLFLRFLSAGG